jgi:hypothetical protein
MLGVLISDPKHPQSLNPRSSATMTRKLGRDVIIKDNRAGKSQAVNIFFEDHCRRMRMKQFIYIHLYSARCLGRTAVGNARIPRRYRLRMSMPSRKSEETGLFPSHNQVQLSHRRRVKWPIASVHAILASIPHQLCYGEIWKTARGVSRSQQITIAKPPIHVGSVRIASIAC